MRRRAFIKGLATAAALAMGRIYPSLPPPVLPKAPVVSTATMGFLQTAMPLILQYPKSFDRKAIARGILEGP